MKRTPEDGQTSEIVIEYFGGPLHGCITAYADTQKDLQCFQILEKWDSEMDYAIYLRIEADHYPHESFRFWGLASGEPWVQDE